MSIFTQNLEERITKLESELSEPKKLRQPKTSAKFEQLLSLAKQQQISDEQQIRLNLISLAYCYIALKVKPSNLISKTKARKAFEEFWQTFEECRAKLGLQTTRNNYNQLVVKCGEEVSEELVELVDAIQEGGQASGPEIISGKDRFRYLYPLFWGFYQTFFREELSKVYPSQITDSDKKVADSWYLGNKKRLINTGTIKLIEYFIRYCNTDKEEEGRKERENLYNKARGIMQRFGELFQMKTRTKLGYLCEWMERHTTADAEVLLKAAKDFPTPEQTYLNLKYK